MIGIIENWLFNQLGINFNLNKLEDNNIFQDGCILIDILQKYGLLNVNFAESIIPSCDQDQCKKNLKLLKPLFDMLKVNYDDSVIQGILWNKSSVILRLLYETYICLENKQHLYFITQQNYQRVHKSVIGSSDIENTTVMADSGITLESERKCFEQPLLQNRDVIEWYKTKYKLVKDNLDLRLNEIKKINSKKADSKKEKKENVCSCSYTGSLEIDESLPELDSYFKFNSHEHLLNYDQFISLFKTKQHHKSAKKCFENSIQNDLLNQTWSKIVDKQNEIYNSVFSEIVLRQSQYEKQILTKLIQTQEQIKIQNESQIQTTKSLLNEEEKQLSPDLELEEKFQDIKTVYENEQKRVLELHRKLYNEKKNIIRKRRSLLCSDVMDAIIDLTINTSEYQLKYGVPVPINLWNNWMQLFIKSQEIHIPYQKLESQIVPGDDINYDEIIAFERDQDDVINENDVEEYLFTCGKWFYKSMCLQLGSFNENMLATIVYRLLFLKYPPPEPPLPADLPPFKLAAVLLNFYSLELIEKIKVLLSKPRVHVFDPDTAIKKCIDTYQKETSPPIEVKYKSKKEQSKNKSPKDKNLKKVHTDKTDKKSSKGKKEKLKTSIIFDKEEEHMINLIDKETQTSIIKEVDDKPPERTPLGLIGEEVFNILKSGEIIDDALLVSVIVEYLKTLDDANGWLLLNYPLTLNQASTLELALTGKSLPVEDYSLEDNLSTKEDQLDELSQCRKSQILPPPVMNTEVSSFKTHFTTVIKTKQNVTQIPGTTKIDYTQNVESEFNNEDDHETETLLPDLIEVFYKDQCIFNEFYFDNFDLITLKKLARTILKEDVIGARGSVDLFGEEVLSKLSQSKKKDKQGKTTSDKKQNPERKNNKKGGKGKVSSPKPSQPNEEDFPGASVDDLEKDQTDAKLQASQDLQFREISPGEQDWQTILLPINKELAFVLATMWENVESCYIMNLKDICFENRMINLRLVPYSKHVQEEVDKIQNKPDIKQDIVNIFQEYYNSMENKLRVLSEVKSQLFCKALEMQQSLWKVADDRKQESEAKRQEIINKNWLVYEICMLMNNYLSLVQMEFDRSLETMKTVNDYYLGMLNKSPPVLTDLQFSQTCVTKVSVETLLHEPIEPPFNTPRPTQQPCDGDDFDNKGSHSNCIAKALINCYEKENILNLLDGFILRGTEHAKKRLDTISQVFYNQIGAESDLLSNIKKRLAKDKNVSSKKSVTTKTDNGKTKNKISIIKPVIEKDTTNAYLTNEMLLKEWKFVIDTEMDRFRFRLDLIARRANENIMEFYCYLESVFCELYNSTLSRYDTDILNINKLCDYLRTAIEEESPLHCPFVLQQGNFFVDTNQHFRTKTEQEGIKELLENTDECYFTINQLNNLKNIFTISGPCGVIRKQPLCYILEDLMLFNYGDNQPQLPKMWNLLTESQLRTVMDAMFGPEYAVDWRDFIIYNLEISYPAVEDILSLRKQFSFYDSENTEMVSFENYEKIILWFEKDLPESPQEGLRIALTKKLLYDLFQVDENNINYTALLLYFCKDIDPKLGLSKALSLSLGKRVIVSKQELQELLSKEAEIKDTVTTLLTHIVNSIVQIREGVLIYEIVESVSEISVNLNETKTSYSILSDSNTSKDDKFSHKSSLSANETTSKESVSFFRPFENNLPERSWVSKIPCAVIINVLNASFLPQDKTYSLRNHYLSCLEEEADSEGMIEAHSLVHLSCIQQLFSLTNKFKISSPCEILQHCLNTPLRAEFSI